ncbi:hypothetical protein E9840_03365 [Tissierella creatinini]|nr:hypothetical protein E9840_03365 [Tissierella creatinini]
MNYEIKGKLKRIGILILLIIFIISLYKFYTRPVGLHNLIYNGNIKSIDVYIVFNGSGNRDEIELINKPDINRFINILNKYKYSKIPKEYIGGVYPSSTNDLIDIRIVFNDSKVSHQQISVEKNDVMTVNFGNGKYRDYKAKGNDGLYEELLRWFSTNFQ